MVGKVASNWTGIQSSFGGIAKVSLKAFDIFDGGISGFEQDDFAQSPTMNHARNKG